jgi:hypothetical protein
MRACPSRFSIGYSHFLNSIPLLFLLYCTVVGGLGRLRVPVNMPCFRLAGRGVGGSRIVGRERPHGID